MKNNLKLLTKLTLLISFIFTCAYSNDRRELPNNAPAIFKAIESKDYSKITSLLKSGIKPCEMMKQPYKSGTNIDFAFNYAIGTGDKKIVKLFLPYIDDITKISCSYSPSVSYAIINNDTNMISFLIDNGADINFVTKNYYVETAIQEALLREKINTAQFLINHGASLKDKIGFKALEFSIKNLYIDNVKFLIKNNVNLNYKDKDGNTILHLMAKGMVEKNLKNIKKYLEKKQHIKQFPDTYVKIEKSMKKIKIKFNNYPKIANLLIASGANTNLKNNNGKIPLLLAKENKIDTMIKVLKN